MAFRDLKRRKVVEDIEDDEEIEYHSAPKKKKSREIICDKCNGVGRLTGEQSPQSSLPSESEEKGQKSRDGVLRLTGEKSPQSPCDKGHRGAGRSCDERDFQVTYESLKILRYLNPIFSGFCC